MLGMIYMKHHWIYCRMRILFETIGMKSKFRKVRPTFWQPILKSESVLASICRSCKILIQIKTLSPIYYHDYNKSLNCDSQNSCIKHASDSMLYSIHIHK